MALPELRTAAVVGTGLIGTSVALALTARGVTTYLIDRDGAAARTAAALGAGTAGAPPAPVDLAVLAVPPGKVAEVLEEHQKDATNAEAVAEVLGELAEDLDAVLRVLRTLAATPAGPARTGPAAELTGLLRRGNTGHARIPGKHGGTALPYSSVRVVLRDRANELARLLADASLTGANIEDIRLEHATNKDAGLVELLVAGGSAGRLAADLTRREWTVHV